MSCEWVLVVTVGEFAVRRLSAGMVNHCGRVCLARAPLQAVTYHLAPANRVCATCLW
jgi:hypothetical protein